MSLEDVVKQCLQNTGEQFRNLALDRAAAICDELHAKGLSGADCAHAIRLLKEELGRRKSESAPSNIVRLPRVHIDNGDGTVSPFDAPR